MLLAAFALSTWQITKVLSETVSKYSSALKPYSLALASVWAIPRIPLGGYRTADTTASLPQHFQPLVP